MAAGDLVSYYRVSTERQGRSGLGLEAQRMAVSEYLKNRTDRLIGAFTEIESGRKRDRPQLKAAIDLCRRQKAVLVIAKLDRLARNVAFVSALLESGVRFVAVDMPEAGITFLQMAAVFGEWEARKISERTKAALGAARANGRRLGWAIEGRKESQRVAAIRGATSNRVGAVAFADNVYPVIESIQRAGIQTLSGIASALNSRAIRTARGGEWHATTVRNVLMRRVAA